MLTEELIEMLQPIQKNRVYLGLGSNLGDRRANLAGALDRLRLGGKLKISGVSRLYQTTPVGYADQPDFLNMALEAETELEPTELLDALKKIEADMGRQKTVRNGPRPIDIDIIFYNGLVMETDKLQIPHPRMHTRGFVLAPLADLNPHLFHPELGVTVERLLEKLDLTTEGVELYTSEASLPLPLPRFLFVTGRLAAPWLEDFLGQLAPRIGFEYEVEPLNIDVAAFMSVRFISDNLKLCEDKATRMDLVVLPGFARGDILQLEQKFGVKVVLGPTELPALEPWLCQLVLNETIRVQPHYYSEAQLRDMQSRLTESNIRIFIDGVRVYAFNNQVFAVGGTDEKELRTIFRQLKIDNPAHAYYLGRELYKAALCIQLGKFYRQDREIEF